MTSPNDTSNNNNNDSNNSNSNNNNNNTNTNDNNNNNSSTSIGDEIYNLWMEYETGSTIEARLVKDFDKFEMIVQADEYERGIHQVFFPQYNYNIYPSLLLI